MAGELKPRILSFPIEGDGAGETIKEYLKRRIGFSSKQLSRFKYRKNGIMVNGEKRYVNYILKEGDVLEICLTRGGEPVEDPDACSLKKGPSEAARVLPGEKNHSKEIPGGNKVTEGTVNGGGYLAARDGRLQKIWVSPVAWLAGNYPLRILYEDQDILAADKPSGVVCHPSPGHFDDTLSNQVAEHLGRIGQELDVRVTGRLDKDTSGIVIFALNTETAAQLIKQRQASMMSKLYIARVRGHFSQGQIPQEQISQGNFPCPGYSGDSRETAAAERGPLSQGHIFQEQISQGNFPCPDYSGDSRETVAAVRGPFLDHDFSGKLENTDTIMCGTVDQPLRRESPDSFRMVTAKDGKAARTHYRVLIEMEDGTSLIACRIEHGRTHQIRVHMASIGHPLVGDRLYGIEAENYSPQKPCVSGMAEVVCKNEFCRENSGSPEESGETRIGGIPEESGETRIGGSHKEKDSFGNGAGQDRNALPEFPGIPLMLHAFRAELIQPFTGEKISLEAPLPDWAAPFLAEKELLGAERGEETEKKE